MGGCNSLCIPTKRVERCRENHATLPKIRQSKRNLSTTFNVSEVQQSHDMLNINLATEEELMTLPGVNRPTARNIVEYRQQIGGFRRVEDLALVSGIGASKLETLRVEICVSKGSKPNSLNGSITGGDTPCIPIKPSKPSEIRKKCNINTSNVFQIVKVKGLGLITAQNIVAYRDKKGPFQSVDDLLKVKGIGPAVLSMIRHQICTIDDSDDQGSNSADSGIGPSGAVVTGVSSNSGAGGGWKVGDSMSNTSDQVSQLVAMCGPLTQTSTRPDVLPFTYERDGRSVVRVATWNLQQLTEDKIDNPGVKEVICMTILENGFGVVALQEIAKKEALQKICDELNNPTLPSVSRWRGARGQWDCVISPSPTGRMFQGVEYAAYLFDTEQEVKLNSSSLIDCSTANGDKRFVRKPFLAYFTMQSLDVVLCSVHLKATGLNGGDVDATKTEALTVYKIGETVSRVLSKENDIAILGDFNLAPDSEEFDDFKSKGYRNMLSSDVCTNISTKNMSGTQAYDNIWASKMLQTMHTGSHGVVRQGLTNPWIPDGWSWGGVVSDHCPVWVEFYVDRDMDSQDTEVKLENIKLVSSAPVNEP